MLTTGYRECQEQWSRRQPRGVFVVLSLLWGAIVVRELPDRFDVAGGLLCLAGVSVMMYAPRG